MLNFDYSPAGVPVREDLPAAHRAIWEHLRSPGTWWSGEQRVAIAAESRNALGCALCRQRKEAISPNAVSGSHDSLGELPEHVVDTIHRIRTDPGRLSRAWFDGVLAGGIEDGSYVELVAIVAMLAGVDYFTRALGIDAFALPQPSAGEPSRVRPQGAKPAGAWVEMIPPEDAAGEEAGLYGDAPMVPNIMRALSLVPDEARMLQVTSNAHYVAVAQIPDPTVRRSLDRMQMELVAARVSAMNECFY